MSQFTQLSGRTLWYDGDSTISADTLTHHSLSDSKVYVDKITEDIIRYNNLVSEDERIFVKDGVRNLELLWTIPEHYINMDVNEFVYDRLDVVEYAESLTQDQVQIRMARVATELALFKKFKLYNVLKTIIYIIDTFRKNNVVWGVGRGSSVASYVLYLIGVHDIDSVEYELDIMEFLH